MGHIACNARTLAIRSQIAAAMSLYGDQEVTRRQQNYPTRLVSDEKGTDQMKSGRLSSRWANIAHDDCMSMGTMIQNEHGYDMMESEYHDVIPVWV